MEAPVAIRYSAGIEFALQFIYWSIMHLIIFCDPVTDLLGRLKHLTLQQNEVSDAIKQLKKECRNPAVSALKSEILKTVHVQ